MGWLLPFLHEIVSNSYIFLCYFSCSFDNEKLDVKIHNLYSSFVHELINISFCMCNVLCTCCVTIVPASAVPVVHLDFIAHSLA